MKRPVTLGSKWVESRTHPHGRQYITEPEWLPLQVIDGPYESFEFLENFESTNQRDSARGTEVWATKWVVRYNDNRIELLDEGYFSSWLEPTDRTIDEID